MWKDFKYKWIKKKVPAVVALHIRVPNPRISMRSRWSFDQQGIKRHHFGDATSLLADLITPAILRAGPKKDRKKRRTLICLTSKVVSTLKVLASVELSKKVTAVQTAVQVCQVLIPGPVEISAMPLNTCAVSFTGDDGTRYWKPWWDKSYFLYERQRRRPSVLSHGKGNDRKQSAEDFRHYLREQSKRHHTIDRLKEWGVKKEALDELSGKDENGPSNRQSNECWTCFKGR